MEEHGLPADQSGSIDNHKSGPPGALRDADARHHSTQVVGALAARISEVDLSALRKAKIFPVDGAWLACSEERPIYLRLGWEKAAHETGRRFLVGWLVGWLDVSVWEGDSGA